MALLNEFFGVAVPVIEEHGGRVHQFLGDGVLAVFGAPEPLPDHADRGVDARAARSSPRSRRTSASAAGSASGSTPGS